MPEAAVAAVASWITANAAFVFQAALVVGATAMNAQDARDQRRAARDKLNDSLQDRDVMIRSGVAPRNIVYGRAKVSGPIVFAHSTGTKGEYLHLVVALAGHECDAVEKIYFNEVELPALDASGYVQSGEFSHYVTRNESETHYNVTSVTLPHTPTRIISVSRPTSNDDQDPVVSYTQDGAELTFPASEPTVIINYEWSQADPVVRIKVHLGGPGQVADPDLIAECGDKWTSAHRGDGIPYLYVRLRYDQDIFGQVGLPNISALVRGAKLYDPRTSLTVWSDNAALCAAHYLRHATLGLGSSTAEVPDDEVSVSANVSDEAVSIVDFDRAALATLWATDGAVEGWTSSGATVTVSASQLRLASSGSDPILRRTGLSIAGATNTTVRARIKRDAGAGWDGTVYYTTSGHGESGSYRKAVPEPTYDGDGWAIAEWNMASLTAGGADWTGSTITGVRLDLGNSAADVFYLDWVAIGSENTQKRYTTNGSISTADGRRSNLEALLGPMAGSAVFVQGRWLLRAGAHRSHEFTLDESWLAGGRIRLMPRRPRTELFNAVTGKFIDPAQAYAEAQVPIVSNATYEAEDGGKRITRSVTMPLINESVRAQRLNKITLERARQALAFEAVCNMRAYDTLPTQVGRVNLARYGFANKLFEVRRRVYNPLERTVTLTLVETASTVWDWQYGEATNRDPAPNTSLPSTAQPAELAGLAVASGTAQLTQLADGTLITRGLVTWTQSTDVFVTRGGRVEIQWKLPANTAWQSAPHVSGDATSTYIGPLDDRELTIVRVRPVNSTGRPGPWAYITHLVQGKTEVPSNVAGLAATVVQSGVRINWTPNTSDLDYDLTELRVGASWAAGALLFLGSSSTYTWLSPAAGSYTVWAKHTDTSGNESATAVSVAVVVDAAMAVLWSSVSGDGKPLDNAGRVLDTRSENAPPSAYPVGNTREFKTCSAIGLSAGATFCVLETIKGWADSSGGYATQWAYVTSGEVWKRSALVDASTWGSWVRDLDRNLYTGDLNATNGATFGVNISGQAGTAHIAPGAATDVIAPVESAKPLPVTFDGTGGQHGQFVDGASITPSVDCYAELTLTVDASAPNSDWGRVNVWIAAAMCTESSLDPWYADSNFYDIDTTAVIQGKNGLTNLRATYTIVGRFSLAAGVPVRLGLVAKGKDTSSLYRPTIYALSYAVTVVKR